MKVLVTRTPDDAAPLVEALEARGHDCLVEPLFTVVPLEVDETALAEALAEAPGGVQALLFTSANGARVFAARSTRRDLPVFAVGDATAAAARAAGFERVESAGGDVEALASLVAERLDPAHGALFHAAASQIAGDLQGSLAAKGFSLRRLILYEAQPLAALSPAAQAALRQGGIDAALFFSPRSGGSFVRLLSDAGLQGSARGVQAICLSAAVAEAVAPLAWAGTVVAARPETAALLDALDRLAARPDNQRQEGVAGLRPQADGIAEGQQVDDKQSDDKRPDDAGAGGDDAAAKSMKAQADKTQAEGATEAPALAVIAAFGGIRPMAAKLGIAVSTVQGWRERAVIPQPRHEEIMTAARNHGVALDAALLAASDHPPATAPSARSALPQSGGGKTSGEPSETSSKMPSEKTPAPATSDAAKSPPPAAAARASEAKAAQESRRGGAGWAFFLLGALVFGAGAAAAVVTRPQWEPLLAELTGEPAPGSGTDVAAVPPELDQRLAALESKLGELDAELARVAAQPSTGGDGAAVEGLTSSLDGLSGRLDALEKEVQAAASSGTAGGLTEESLASLRGTVEQLTARLDALEGQAQGDAADSQEVASLSEDLTGLAARLSEAEGRLAKAEDDRRELQANLDQYVEDSQAARASAGGGAALALAVAQLRDALRSGAPYQAELQQLRALSHDDPQLAALLDPLAPHADSGAPTLEALQHSFPPAARDAVAAGQGDEAEGWLGGVLRRVSGVVTVRPVGDVEGDSPGAIIARAETRLQGGDLAGAVSELDSLQGRAAEEMRPWRDQAQARVVAERALSQLAAHAIARLGPEDG